MKFSTGPKTGLAAAIAALCIAGGCSSTPKAATSPTSAPISGSSVVTTQPVVTRSRGFDGTTITVAGLGTGTVFAGADVGARARFKRFNDSNEIPGIRINYTEFADDKADPAVATSEVRRLVTQGQVFAIVPDLSPVNPGTYLNSQHVPYVGYGIDNTYCSTTPSTSLYGFGFNGCVLPADPPVVSDTYSELYKFVSQKTGKANPTIAITGGDIEAGRNSARFGASAAEGAGFKVVYAKGNVPQVVSDYTPYVQQWIAADSGKQPDVIDCLLAVECIQAWQAKKGAGFTGTFYNTLAGVDALAKSLQGNVGAIVYNTQPNPGLAQMEADLDVYKPGTTPVSYSNVPAYLAADMFVQALKKIGRDITPEAMQKALANQTWQIGGLVGPTDYPASTVAATPNCSELVQDTSGTGWNVVEPYACSSKTFPVDPKFTG